MIRICDRYGGESGVGEVLVRTCKRRRPLGRPRCKWDLNIRMGVMEIF
jgi:hypothetical protein